MEYSRDYILTGILALTIVMAVLQFSFIITQSNKIPILTYKSNITESLDIIYKNCGSTFITKRYGDSSYSVFSEVCNEDDFCKPVYTSLEDCLK